VTPISVADARDIFRFRGLLEAACVAEAARAASDEELRALGRSGRFSARAFPAGFIAYNRAFHCALADLSKNRRLASATRDMIEQMDRLVQVSVGMIEGRDPARLVREHGAIVSALRRRDGKRAARLVRAHVADAERRVAAALDRFVVIS
jgi:DNA-binding GntR family transcriptional regulator